MSDSFELAVFGGGCFWCLEAAFARVKGVQQVASGYAGGQVENPTYESVCSGNTGHAEIVSITFEPDLISYSDLLQLFFDLHDPTTLNRQGADVGTQYRSAIFPQNTSQRAEAVAAINALNDSGALPAAVVTTIESADTVYAAEAYHSDYFQNNPQSGYCQMVVAPKLKKFLLQHADKTTGAE